MTCLKKIVFIVFLIVLISSVPYVVVAQSAEKVHTADMQDKFYEKYESWQKLAERIWDKISSASRTFAETALTDNVGTYKPFKENALNVKINIDSDRKNYILSIGNYVNDEINLDDSNEDDSDKDAFPIQSITLYYNGKSTGIICGYVFGKQNEVWLDYSVLDDAVKKGWFDKSARNAGIAKVIEEFAGFPHWSDPNSLIIDVQNSTLVYNTDHYVSAIYGRFTTYYLGLVMQDGSYRIFSSLGDPAKFTGISETNYTNYVIDRPQLSDDKTGYTFSIKFDSNSKHITSEIFIDGKDGKITEISRKSVDFTVDDTIYEILTSKDCHRYVYNAYYQYEFPAGDNLIYELVTLFQGTSHVNDGDTVKFVPFYIESYYLYIIRKDGSYIDLTSKIAEVREIKQYEKYEVDNLIIEFKIDNIKVSENNTTLTFDLYDSQHKKTPIKCSVDINTEKITLSE